MHLLKKCTLLSFLLFFCQSFIQTQADIKLIEQKYDQTTSLHTVKLDVSLSENELLYKDYLNFSVDSPDIKVLSWKPSITPINHINSEFKNSKKENKKVFNKNFSLTLKISNNKTQDEIIDKNIHMIYYLESSGKIEKKIVALSHQKNSSSIQKESVNNQNLQTQIDLNNSVKKNTIAKKNSLYQTLSDLVKTTNSVWLQIFLALLLGVLMSLTPCIYPMIPITVGILQSQGEKSITRNFLLSLSYTCGIATTFALLGLMAAFTGQVFGTLMTNPIFITTLVLFLGYLALSMFGFYDMYTPKFLQNNNTSHSGSLISIFLFGAISGTIASPCLSPGLILLLSIVSTLGSKMLGFILLFNFGLGLGVPLLLIGTFSGSLSVLPKAGLWMIEIKKLFGFMLFGMIFYFLNNILPLNILLLLISIFILISGAYYLYASLQNNNSSTKKRMYSIAGTLLCGASIVLGFKAYQETFLRKKMPIDTFWQKNYEEALSVAIKEKKYLFIDVGAPFCSICKAIDKTVFCDENVRTALKKFVDVKVDGSYDKCFEELQKRYNIIGFPAFLLIDPNNGKLVKRWASELYDMPNEEFIKELKKIT